MRHASTIRRTFLAAFLSCYPIASHAHAATPPPGWSSQFVDAGLVFDIFSDGGVCLASVQTSAGPRLFVGGEFTAARTPNSPSFLPAAGVAVWDGARWSSIAGGGVSSGFGDGSVRAITSLQIGGVQRTVLAGFFAAPQTGDGIGYLDDARVLHQLSDAPVPSAWFGGACGWTPPSSSTQEIIVTSGVFPQGSDYGYRFKESSVATLPPGLITVTNAFAEFDDGSGRALFIGVPMVGSGPQTITRWNGASLSPVNVGPISWVNAICVHDDGNGPALYVAGQGAIRRMRNGIWEAAPAGGPSFGINALASFNDGSGPALYAAGQFNFTPAGSTPTANIARLRGGVWEALSHGNSGITGGAVQAMATFDEDGPGPRPPGLFIAGKFSAAGGISSVGIARWGVPVCRADYDASGATQVNDIFAFLSDWFTATPAADFNASGAIEVQDIFDFIAAWFAGC